MEILIGAVIIGLIPAVIAQSKGKSFVLWWVYGAAIFIVALPHAIVMRSDDSALENKRLSEGEKKCPHCAELVKADARVCKHCRRDI